MAITKGLDGWDKKEEEDGTSVDYWQYLHLSKPIV